MPESITSILEEKESIDTLALELFCQYCKKPINAGFDAYTQSFSKTKNGVTAWHYQCYERDHTEIITMSNKTKMELCKYLVYLREQGRKESFIEKALNACGYK